MITIFKIKKGKKAKLQKWLRSIHTQHWKEAAKSIAHEGLQREATTIIDNYLIFFTEGTPQRRSLDPVSIKHRAILKECVDFPSQSNEFLYDIEVA